MLDTSYKAVVHHTVATSAEEIQQVYARLSDAVGHGLAAELDAFGEVHKYDAEGRCAYYFERQGATLVVWSWKEVHHFHEAGELFFLIASSPDPLDEMSANKFYAQATGRTVEHPPPAPSAASND